ncbi:MAG: CRTAC1 family protein [Candidatus Hinthialibacter antarcticus]|nr:CRTAC1 family protein [Candidatus Hinthialibacter antarcticus]
MKLIRAYRWSAFVLGCSIVFSFNANSQDTMFIDRSVESGMQDDFIYRQLGVSWSDYDEDGFMDVFIATTPNNRLFKNNGDNTFTDVAETFELQDPMAEAATSAWGDYDGDGDLDLFVGNLGPMMSGDGGGMMVTQNRLYQNNGGQFTDVAEQAGVSGIPEGVTGGTTSASWADYDNDGDIDLLNCNRMLGVYLYQNQGDGAFIHATMSAGLHGGIGGMANSYEHGVWADYDLDGDLDLFLSAGVAMTMPMSTDAEMTAMSVQPMQMSMMSSNKLYQNQGDGTFTDATTAAGLMYETNAARSHTAVWGDFNNDGYPDLFSGNRGSITMNTLAQSRLYQNNQDGTFTDVTDLAGMSEEFSVFGAAWADVNNDGLLDLYIAIHPDMRDYPDHHINPTRIPHPLYIANGDGTFTNVNADLIDLPYISGITDLGHQGGAAFGDSDNDGDLDLVIVEAMGLGPMRFYENATAATGANWLQIELRSSGMNTRAIGAKIIVETPGKTQSREVGFCSTGWGSQAPYAQSIGLGDASQANVRVIWPDGAEEDFGAIEINAQHTLEQSITSHVSDWMLLK